MAVLGADFTLNYFHRILSDTLPFCPDRNSQVKGSSIRCFLMDERGYLLAHPNLLEPAEMAATAGVEQQHLTHHEPLGTRPKSHLNFSLLTRTLDFGRVPRGS